ncbi:MAG: hypothetical protein CMK59_07200 [Proteobacteria bacterium]|nr:hypothetical protein [Pseudomonadota bacterium]
MLQNIPTKSIDDDLVQNKLGCPFAAVFSIKNKPQYLIVSEKTSIDQWIEALFSFANTPHQGIFIAPLEAQPNHFDSAQPLLWKQHQNIIRSICTLNRGTLKQYELMGWENIAQALSPLSPDNTQLDLLFEHSCTEYYHSFIKPPAELFGTTLLDPFDAAQAHQLLFFTVGPYYPKDHPRFAKHTMIVSTKINDIPHEGTLLKKTQQWLRSQPYRYEKCFHAPPPNHPLSDRNTIEQYRQNYIQLRSNLQHVGGLVDFDHAQQAQAKYFLILLEMGLGKEHTFTRYLDLMKP